MLGCSLFILLLVLSTTINGLRISCGRSFIACEEEEEPSKITPHRVYGVPNLPHSSRPRIPEAMLRTAALDAQKGWFGIWILISFIEIDKVLDESEARPLELSMFYACCWIPNTRVKDIPFRRPYPSMFVCIQSVRLQKLWVSPPM